MAAGVQAIKYSLAIMALGAVVAGSPSYSDAATRFGMACVKNETRFNVRFRFKVGKGQWRKRSIFPGRYHWFSHKYDRLDENRSPTLLVEYDSDGRNNKRFNVRVRLQRKAATGQSCKEGAQYAFIHERANRDFIILVRRR